MVHIQTGQSYLPALPWAQMVALKELLINEKPISPHLRHVSLIDSESLNSLSDNLPPNLQSFAVLIHQMTEDWERLIVSSLEKPITQLSLHYLEHQWSPSANLLQSLRNSKRGNDSKPKSGSANCSPRRDSICP
jgi:hypothetical protein